MAGGAIRIDDGVMVREIDREFLLLDTRSNQIHRLNSTASFIWRMWRDGASQEAIASALAAEFTVDRQTAIDDVEDALSKLRALKVLAEG